MSTLPSVPFLTSTPPTHPFFFFFLLCISHLHHTQLFFFLSSMSFSPPLHPPFFFFFSMSFSLPPHPLFFSFFLLCLAFPLPHGREDASTCTLSMAKIQHGQNSAWPKFSMAKTQHGQNSAWPKFSMAKTQHGQNLAWLKLSMAKMCTKECCKNPHSLWLLLCHDHHQICSLFDCTPRVCYSYTLFVGSILGAQVLNIHTLLCVLI